MIFSDVSITVALKIMGAAVLGYFAVKVFLTAWNVLTWNDVDYQKYRNIYGKSFRERLQRLISGEGLVYELGYPCSAGCKTVRNGQRVKLVRTSRPLV